MEHQLPAHFGDAVRLLKARSDTLDYFVREGTLSRGPREFEYRDHRFDVCSFGRGRRVFIYAPGSGTLFKDVPRSFKPDSRDAVIQEAKETVDQRIRENRRFFEQLEELQRTAKRRSSASDVDCPQRVHL